MERANGDLQQRLGKWLEENKDCGWALGLQHVMYSMNTSVSATTEKTPYEVVFGQAPRTSCTVLEMLAEQGALNEEDIEDSLIESIDDLAVPSTSASTDELAVPSTPASTDDLAVPSTSASTEDADTTPSEEEAEVQEISEKRKRSNSSSDSEDDTPHDKIRKVATANYLKAAKKQQVQFDSNRITKFFSVGDTVGINIHEEKQNKH